MRYFKYDSLSPYSENTRSLHDERFGVDYTKVERIVDDSYFVPSTEQVKRISRSHPMKGLYDSPASLEAGIEPSYARHPSRDIVELQRFNEALYARIEKALQSDLEEAQRKTLEKEKKRLDEARSVMSILEQEKVSTSEKE